MTAACPAHDLRRMDHYGHPTELLWCVECGEMQTAEAPPCTWELCWCRRPEIWEEYGSIMRFKQARDGGDGEHSS